MKLQTKNSHKKLIIGSILAIVIILAGLVVYAYAFQGKTTTSSDKQPEPKVNQVNKDPPTKEQVKTGQDIKQESVEKATNPTPPSTSTPLVVSITAANQNGATVTIRSFVDAVSSASGTCTLAITNGSKSTTKTASTQAYPSGSTCQGFDIASSELGPGNWNAKLTVTIGTQSGSASQAITVQ